MGDAVSEIGADVVAIVGAVVGFVFLDFLLFFSLALLLLFIPISMPPLSLESPPFLLLLLLLFFFFMVNLGLWSLTGDVFELPPLLLLRSTLLLLFLDLLIFLLVPRNVDGCNVLVGAGERLGAGKGTKEMVGAGLTVPSPACLLAPFLLGGTTKKMSSSSVTVGAGVSVGAELVLGD